MLVIVAFVMVFNGSAFAAEPVIPESIKDKTISDLLSEEQKGFLKKLQNVFGKFYFDDNGFLKLNITYEELQGNYGFCASDIEQLDNILNAVGQINSKGVNNEQFNTGSFNIGTGEIKPNIFVENWIIYFTYDDVTGLLVSAAMAGPAAMYAALNAIAYLTTGAGGIVVTVLSTLGLAGLADFCYLVIQAEVRHQGVYIGIVWNGVFPNIVQGTW